MSEQAPVRKKAMDKGTRIVHDVISGLSAIWGTVAGAGIYTQSEALVIPTVFAYQFAAPLCGGLAYISYLQAKDENATKLSKIFSSVACVAAGLGLGATILSDPAYFSSHFYAVAGMAVSGVSGVVAAICRSGYADKAPEQIHSAPNNHLKP